MLKDIKKNDRPTYEDFAKRAKKMRERTVKEYNDEEKREYYRQGLSSVAKAVSFSLMIMC